jgi:Protein of unknown function (DUF3300)
MPLEALLRGRRLEPLHEAVIMKSFRRKLALALCGSLLVAGSACGQESPVAVPEPQPAAAQPAQQSSGKLEQLVAPIALYPDELVGQILTASTYPTAVIEASRWMHQHLGLEGQSLADAVDQQPWDPSVKALTEFPSLLDNMNENLSWTSALGEAYVNEPEEVMNAVQALRKRAQAAGTLTSTSQQTVTTEDDSIVIEPADPAVVYVPAYDPWLVYGVPLAAYPDWVAIPGVFYAGPDLYFGVGFDAGPVARFPWWWHEWRCDWRRHEVHYHHAPYFTHSRTFFARRDFEAGHARFERSGVPLVHPEGRFDRSHEFHAPAPEFHSPEPQFRPPEFRGPSPEFHPAPPLAPRSLAPRADGGFHPGGVSESDHAGSGFRPGAFSGFDHGGTVRSYASRGMSSLGGRPEPPFGGSVYAGGGSRGAAAGSHGGEGFHGGGHR